MFCTADTFLSRILQTWESYIYNFSLPRRAAKSNGFPHTETIFRKNDKERGNPGALFVNYPG